MRRFPMIRAGIVYVPRNELRCASGVEWVQAADGEEKKGPRRFTMNAYTGGAMDVGWGVPVVVDLAGLKSSSGPKIFLEHDRQQRVGHIDNVDVVASKLKVSGVVSSSSEAAQQVLADADNGYPWQASIGAKPVKVEFVDKGETAEANGKTFRGPLYVVRQSVLAEVSFVSLGADDRTSATIAASAAEVFMEFSEWLKAKGFGDLTLSEQQKSTLMAQFKAEQAPAPEPAAEPVVDLVAEQRKLLAAEATRVAKINDICKGHGDICARAIGENWTTEKAELEVLRASRPQAPAGFVVNAELATPDVLAAAISMAGNLPNIEKRFDQQTLNAADKHRRIGLQELLLKAAAAGGYTGGGYRVNSGNMKSVLEAAFSTAAISGILSNVANKFLLAGFTAVENTWSRIASRRSVNDFKTITSYRMTGDNVYEKVAPGGEIKHGTLGEESYTNKADTYGKMFAITRQDIINDDLGALTAIPQRLGMGAGLKLNTVFWTAFLASRDTFWASGHKNLQTGSALGYTALSEALALFRNMVDSDGNFTALAPAILLVPPALEVSARNFFASPVLASDGTSGAKFGTANVFAGQFRPEVSAYLSLSSIANYSATQAFLLADPSMLSTIEVAFLNGNESPTVETAEADFNVLGIQMRGYHDFGVSLQDYRASVRIRGT